MLVSGKLFIMSELNQYRKAELIELADELEVELLTTDKVVGIIKKIESSVDFDKELAIAQIKIIREDRLKREENERLAYESGEKQKEREHELEKIKMSLLNETASLGSEREERKNVISLKNMIQNFDPEKSEISLYLNLFERQAEKAEIPIEQYVTQLLPLLPINLAEVILRESTSRADDYKYIKEVLLNRFKINAESFRVKFMQTQRASGSLWKDLKYDLNTYLEGWLSALKVVDFEGLKKLMVADQIKKRTPPEVKEHFIDTWANIIDPDTLADKLDSYEAVRKPVKKPVIMKTVDDKRNDRPKGNEKIRENRLIDKKLFNWRNKDATDQKERDRAFEKRRVACYECNSTQHLRPFCPRLQKKDAHNINHVGNSDTLNDSFKPYLSTVLINKVEILALRDTGASIDLIPGRLVTPHDLNGETVWLKQALENEFHCLPIANVELEIPEVGCIIQTKAAVVDTSIKMDHYLLSNQTQEILNQMKNKREIVNMVTTRSKKQSIESELKKEEEKKPEVLAEVTDWGACDLPPLDNSQDIAVSRMDRESFKDEQKKDPSLSNLWDKGKSEKNTEFIVEKDLLFRVTKDHRGNARRQLILPTSLRKEILSLCHDGIGAHMGCTKTKDKILRHYFWPGAIKDIEYYVKTCDPCQRIDKGGEVKKAPLKLVPVIQEIFTRINCDLVGPLPESEKKNKFILTAMCLSSRYPEAIPVRDTKSDTVIEGLLTVFSRFGFPKELQADLGSCFTSELTVTFCEKFNIKVIHSSVHRPQSNAIERWHRSVKRLLKVLCLESGDSWEKTLPMALLALRTVTHESTNFSPAELVHGKNLRTVESLLFEKWTDSVEEETPVTEYVFELVNRMKRCQELAIERMEETRDKRKEWYDKNTVERKFKPGDQVLVMATVKPNKLSVSWIGPGTVERQISETNYIVNVPGRRQQSQIYHINLLKPYHKRVELVNILLREDPCKEIIDADLEIEYPAETSTVYNFNEIVRDNALVEKFSPDQVEQLKSVLDKYKNLFSNEPGRTDLIEHDIELITEKPFRMKPYRSSHRQNEILKKEIRRMVDLKLIEVGESDYTPQ